MPPLRLSWTRSEPALGIDFGAGAVRAVALGHDRHGISLLGADREPLPEGAVAGGVVRNPEAAGAALARLLGRMEVRGRSAVLGMGGPSVFVRRLTGVPAAPADGPDDRAAFREAVAREAARHLPFHIEDLEFDFQPAAPAAAADAARTPGRSEGPAEPDAPRAPEGPESSVVFAAAPRDAIRAHRGAARAANREASRVEIEPYALFAALRLQAGLAGSAAPVLPRPAAAPTDPAFSPGAQGSLLPLLLVEAGSARAGVHLFESPPAPPDRAAPALPARRDPGELLASVQVSWVESAAGNGSLPGSPGRGPEALSSSRRKADRRGAPGPGDAITGGLREALREGGRQAPLVVRLGGSRARENRIAEPLAEFSSGDPLPLDPLGGLSAAAAGPEFGVAAGLAFLRLLDLAPASGRRR